MTDSYLEDALKVANNIISQTEKQGKKWEDPDFPCAQKSLYRRGRGAQVAAWKRPNEMAPSPRLFVDGVESGDVIQGTLGDCYFLGAIAVLATRRDLLLPLFVSARPSLGFYQIKFFKNGRWVIVTIDDRLPVNSSGKLVFARCKDENEMWVPLIEKAYAKLHNYYEAIESGSIASALMDLTGEAAQTFDFNQGEGLDLIKKGKLWGMLMNFEKEKFLLGCSCRKGGIESDTGMGILGNHAYSVLQAVEVSARDKLLRIRNPWGHTEWRGRWSDNSKEWTPALKKKLNFEFGDDGTFFISYDDFLDQYDNLFVCRLLTDQVGHVYQQLSFEHGWTKETAGGCSNNPTWRNNDQWAITVPKQTDTFIALIQSDQRMIQGKDEYKVSIGFTIFQMDNSRKIASPAADKVYKQVPYMTGRHTATTVDFAPGQYIIVPTTFDAGNCIPYFLQIFSYHSIECDLIGTGPGNAAAYTKGKWSGKSAGGCFNHTSWVDNPKYLLKFEKTTGSAEVEFQLSQGTSSLCFIGMYLFSGYQNGQPLTTNQMVKSVTCTNKAEINLPLSLSMSGCEFVIMPTTFKSGETNTFELFIQTKEKVTLYELNGSASGRMTATPITAPTNSIKAKQLINVRSGSKRPGPRPISHEPEKNFGAPKISIFKKKEEPSKTEEPPKKSFFAAKTEAPKPAQPKPTPVPKPAPKPVAQPKPREEPPKKAPVFVPRAEPKSKPVTTTTTRQAPPPKKNDVYVPKAQPKPKSTSTSIGVKPNASLSTNTKGELILNFGKKANKTTTTVYTCGKCGGRVASNSSNCGSCGVKLKR